MDGYILMWKGKKDGNTKQKKKKKCKYGAGSLMIWDVFHAWWSRGSSEVCCKKYSTFREHSLCLKQNVALKKIIASYLSQRVPVILGTLQWHKSHTQCQLIMILDERAKKSYQQPNNETIKSWSMNCITRSHQWHSKNNVGKSITHMPKHKHTY